MYTTTVEVLAENVTTHILMAQKSDELQRIEENGSKIRDLLNEMESDADDLDTKLSEANDKIDDLNYEIDTLKSEKRDDAETIEQLQKEITRLEGLT